MNLVLKTAPTEEFITDDEIIQQLRLDEGTGSPDQLEDADLVDAFIKTAIAFLDGKDGILGRALVTQTWYLKLDKFPCFDPDTRSEEWYRGNEVQIPLPPVQSITAITYYDLENELQTFSAAKYELVHRNGVAYVKPKINETWPDTYSGYDKISIEFVAGYGAASAVPTPIKTAARMIVGSLYQNREGQVLGNMSQFVENPVVDSLLARYKVQYF